jgi:1-acyl-sn-glycerol-3-phosphate acyltransferase
MQVDGFEPAEANAFAGYREQLASPIYHFIDRLAARLHIDVDGLANVPSGRALLVANHSFGWEVIVPMAAMARRLERRVWVLGEHAWWKVPFVRRAAAALGVVDGTRENAERLLASDELVLVLPGGLREAVKPQELRYQLLWGRRYGFVKLALRMRAPLVPLACIGADDWFDFVGDAYARGSRWFGSKYPVPLPRRILPIPHLAKMKFLLGEPVVSEYGPESADDLRLVRRLRREVEGALHELIEEELARRAGIELD